MKEKQLLDRLFSPRTPVLHFAIDNHFIFLSPLGEQKAFKAFVENYPKYPIAPTLVISSMALVTFSKTTHQLMTIDASTLDVIESYGEVIKHILSSSHSPPTFTGDRVHRAEMKAALLRDRGQPVEVSELSDLEKALAVILESRERELLKVVIKTDGEYSTEALKAIRKHTDNVILFQFVSARHVKRLEALGEVKGEGPFKWLIMDTRTKESPTLPIRKERINWKAIIEGKAVYIGTEEDKPRFYQAQDYHAAWRTLTWKRLEDGRIKFFGVKKNVKENEELA